MKQKRKLDGVLFYMAFVAFALLSALTITQQLEIWELAKQQTAILNNQELIIDVMLLIEERESDNMIWKEWNKGVRDGTKLRNSITTH